MSDGPEYSPEALGQINLADWIGDTGAVVTAPSASNATATSTASVTHVSPMPLSSAHPHTQVTTNHEGKNGDSKQVARGLDEKSEATDAGSEESKILKDLRLDFEATEPWDKPHAYPPPYSGPCSEIYRDDIYKLQQLDWEVFLPQRQEGTSIVWVGPSNAGKTIGWGYCVADLAMPRNLAMVPSPAAAKTYYPTLGRPFVNPRWDQRQLIKLMLVQRRMMDRDVDKMDRWRKLRETRENNRRMSDLADRQHVLRAWARQHGVPDAQLALELMNESVQMAEREARELQAVKQEYNKHLARLKFRNSFTLTLDDLGKVAEAMKSKVLEYAMTTFRHYGGISMMLLQDPYQCPKSARAQLLRIFLLPGINVDDAYKAYNLGRANITIDQLRGMMHQVVVMNRRAEDAYKQNVVSETHRFCLAIILDSKSTNWRDTCFLYHLPQPPIHIKPISSPIIQWISSLFAEPPAEAFEMFSGDELEHEATLFEESITGRSTKSKGGRKKAGADEDSTQLNDDESNHEPRAAKRGARGRGRGGRGGARGRGKKSSGAVLFSPDVQGTVIVPVDNHPQMQMQMPMSMPMAMPMPMPMPTQFQMQQNAVEMDEAEAALFAQAEQEVKAEEDDRKQDGKQGAKRKNCVTALCTLDHIDPKRLLDEYIGPTFSPAINYPPKYVAPSEAAKRQMPDLLWDEFEKMSPAAEREAQARRAEIKLAEEQARQASAPKQPPVAQHIVNRAKELLASSLPATTPSPTQETKPSAPQVPPAFAIQSTVSPASFAPDLFTGGTAVPIHMPPLPFGSFPPFPLPFAPFPPFASTWIPNPPPPITFATQAAPDTIDLDMNSESHQEEFDFGAVWSPSASGSRVAPEHAITRLSRSPSPTDTENYVPHVIPPATSPSKPIPIPASANSQPNPNTKDAQSVTAIPAAKALSPSIHGLAEGKNDTKTAHDVKLDTELLPFENVMFGGWDWVRMYEEQQKRTIQRATQHGMGNVNGNALALCFALNAFSDAFFCNVHDREEYKGRVGPVVLREAREFFQKYNTSGPEGVYTSAFSWMTYFGLVEVVYHTKLMELPTHLADLSRIARWFCSAHPHHQDICHKACDEYTRWPRAARHVWCGPQWMKTGAISAEASGSVVSAESVPRTAPNLALSQLTPLQRAHTPLPKHPALAAMCARLFAHRAHACTHSQSRLAGRTLEHDVVDLVAKDVELMQKVRILGTRPIWPNMSAGDLFWSQVFCGDLASSLPGLTSSIALLWNSVCTHSATVDLSKWLRIEPPTLRPVPQRFLHTFPSFSYFLPTLGSTLPPPPSSSSSSSSANAAQASPARPEPSISAAAIPSIPSSSSTVSSTPASTNAPLQPTVIANPGLEAPSRDINEPHIVPQDPPLASNEPLHQQDRKEALPLEMSAPMAKPCDETIKECSAATAAQPAFTANQPVQLDKLDNKDLLTLPSLASLKESCDSKSTATETAPEEICLSTDDGVRMPNANNLALNHAAFGLLHTLNVMELVATQRAETESLPLAQPEFPTQLDDYQHVAPPEQPQPHLQPQPQPQPEANEKSEPHEPIMQPKANTEASQPIPAFEFDFVEHALHVAGDRVDPGHNPNDDPYEYPLLEVAPTLPSSPRSHIAVEPTQLHAAADLTVSALNITDEQVLYLQPVSQALPAEPESEPQPQPERDFEQEHDHENVMYKAAVLDIQPDLNLVVDPMLAQLEMQGTSATPLENSIKATRDPLDAVDQQLQEPQHAQHIEAQEETDAQVHEQRVVHARDSRARIQKRKSRSRSLENKRPQNLSRISNASNSDPAQPAPVQLNIEQGAETQTRVLQEPKNEEQSDSNEAKMEEPQIQITSAPVSVHPRVEQEIVDAKMQVTPQQFAVNDIWAEAFGSPTQQNSNSVTPVLTYENYDSAAPSAPAIAVPAKAAAAVAQQHQHARTPSTAPPAPSVDGAAKGKAVEKEQLDKERQELEDRRTMLVTQTTLQYLLGGMGLPVPAQPQHVGTAIPAVGAMGTSSSGQVNMTQLLLEAKALRDIHDEESRKLEQKTAVAYEATIRQPGLQDTYDSLLLSIGDLECRLGYSPRDRYLCLYCQPDTMRSVPGNGTSASVSSSSSCSTSTSSATKDIGKEDDIRILAARVRHAQNYKKQLDIQMMRQSSDREAMRDLEGYAAMATVAAKGVSAAGEVFRKTLGIGNNVKFNNLVSNTTAFFSSRSTFESFQRQRAQNPSFGRIPPELSAGTDFVRSVIMPMFEEPVRDIGITAAVNATMANANPPTQHSPEQVMDEYARLQIERRAQELFLERCTAAHTHTQTHTRPTGPHGPSGPSSFAYNQGPAHSYAYTPPASSALPTTAPNSARAPQTHMESGASTLNQQQGMTLNSVIQSNMAPATTNNSGFVLTDDLL